MYFSTPCRLDKLTNTEELSPLMPPHRYFLAQRNVTSCVHSVRATGSCLCSRFGNNFNIYEVNDLLLVQIFVLQLQWDVSAESA